MRVSSVIILVTIVVSITVGFPVDSNNDDQGVSPEHLKPAFEEGDRPYVAENHNVEADLPTEAESNHNEAEEEPIIEILQPENNEVSDEVNGSEEYGYDEGPSYSDEIYDFDEGIGSQKSSGAEPILNPVKPEVEATTEDDTVVISACDPLEDPCEENPNSDDCSSYRERCPDEVNDISDNDSVFQDPYDCIENGGCKWPDQD